MQYQWSRDQLEIPGAVTPVLVVTNATAADTGSYAVTVRNADGALTSEPVLWRVFSFGELVDAPAWPWTTAGDAGWGPTVSTTSDGVDAAESGQIRHSQSTSLRTTLLGPGTLSFRWRVSSEAHYDILRLERDGVTLASISGEVPWTSVTNDLAAGQHVLTWTYGKDGSTSAGRDRAWLDQVRFDPARVQLSWVKSAEGIGQLVLTGPAGGTVRVEWSTDLGAWQEWRSVVNFPGRETIVDSPLDSVMKFYRAVRLP